MVKPESDILSARTHDCLQIFPGTKHDCHSRRTIECDEHLLLAVPNYQNVDHFQTPIIEFFPPLRMSNGWPKTLRPLRNLELATFMSTSNRQLGMWR